MSHSVSKTVQLDVVELLKQVLQWTPVYRPGLNKALLQAAKVGSVGCVKVSATWQKITFARESG